MSEVISLSTIPPGFIALTYNDTQNFASSILYVPQGCVEVYKQDEKFGTILEYNPDYIKEVNKQNKNETAIQYNLMGIPVSNNYNGVVIKNRKKQLNH